MIELNEAEKAEVPSLIVALDVDNNPECRELIYGLNGYVGLGKINGLFTSEGVNAMRLINSQGLDIFLDSKFYDIPSTVRRQVYAATRHDVNMLTIHASGGLKMMKAAVEGAKEGAEHYRTRVPKILGVTVLTSTDQKIMNDELKIQGTVEDQVLHLADLGVEAELDGLVCSGQELHALQGRLPTDYLKVVPGISGPKTGAGNDQKRTMYPGEAIKAGASMLVVGRAIIKAENKQQAAYEILQDMAKVR